MNLIKYRYIFFFISGALMLASVVAPLIWGVRMGIDFSGGTLWQVRITASANIMASDLANFFANDLGVKDAVVYQQTQGQDFIVRIGHISEQDHQTYLTALKNKFGSIDELSYETIGPTIGNELKSKAIWAIALVMLGISLYVAYAFRKVSYPVKSWKYGIITLFTLFHDVVIAFGFLIFLSWGYNVELDTKSIVALLVIMGFSVHDTIVVFDRIRENLILARDREALPEIINTSVNQTMARSINTSLTLVLTLLALFFFGPLSLKYFVLLMMVGVIVGTYSSIFIASPSLLFFKKK